MLGISSFLPLTLFSRSTWRKGENETGNISLIHLRTLLYPLWGCKCLTIFELQLLQKKQRPSFQACEDASRCHYVFKFHVAKELDLKKREIISSLKKAMGQSRRTRARSPSLRRLTHETCLSVSSLMHFQKKLTSETWLDPCL